MNQVGTSKDSMDVRDKLRNTIAATKATAKRAGELVRTLEPDAVAFGSDELDRKRAQRQKLHKDLQVWLQKFTEIAKAAAEKERTSPLPPKPPQPKPYNASAYDDDETDERRGLIEAARGQQLALEHEQQFNDMLIQDREQDIRAIEKTVLEVNEIFVDLSRLVVDQGVLIDNIESNVEKANAQVDTGVSELRQASEYQKSARTKLCILALIVLVVVAAVVLVVYFLLAKK